MAGRGHGLSISRAWTESRGRKTHPRQGTAERTLKLYLNTRRNGREVHKGPLAPLRLRKRRNKAGKKRGGGRKTLNQRNLVESQNSEGA